jgi:hypothetical protein
VIEAPRDWPLILCVSTTLDRREVVRRSSEPLLGFAGDAKRISHALLASVLDGGVFVDHVVVGRGAIRSPVEPQRITQACAGFYRLAGVLGEPLNLVTEGGPDNRRTYRDLLVTSPVPHRPLPQATPSLFTQLTSIGAPGAKNPEQCLEHGRRLSGGGGVRRVAFDPKPKPVLPPRPLDQAREDGSTHRDEVVFVASLAEVRGRV